MEEVSDLDIMAGDKRMPRYMHLRLIKLALDKPSGA